MKSGAILVNTSRGPIIDEKALIEALQARRIVAALDVFDREPLPANHPLRTAPNTVMTPHLGYGVHETWQGFYPQSVENALAFLDGKRVPKRAPRYSIWLNLLRETTMRAWAVVENGLPEGVELPTPEPKAPRC